MAVYTRDGVRHNSEEEALVYLRENHIIIVPPFKDKFYAELHLSDWGDYELQCIPDDTEAIYLELYEGLQRGEDFTGYNLIRYASDDKGKDASELHSKLMKDTALVSMFNQEVKNELLELAGSEVHFYDEEDPEVVITYDIQRHGEEEVTTISYVIDQVVENTVEVKEKDDPLDTLLEDVKSQFLITAEGKFSPEDGKVGGRNVFDILDHAARADGTISINIHGLGEE